MHSLLDFIIDFSLESCLVSLLEKLVSSVLGNPYSTDVLLMLGDISIISHTEPTSAVSP